MQPKRMAWDVYAFAVFFTLFAGDAIRNTLSWWGFGVITGGLTISSAILLVRSHRPAELVGAVRSWRAGSVGLPARLIACFLLLSVLSTAWSFYPGITVIGIVILVATTVGALAVAVCLPADAITRALRRALTAVLVLSLLFELVVAAIVRHPVLPVFPINVEPGQPIPDAFYWSRALLFEGGRIQGIVGNANLLGFVALLALLLALSELLTRSRPRWVSVVGIVAATATLALTRSTTVSVAALAVCVVAVLIVLWRRSPGVGRSVGRRVAAWLFSVALAVGAAAAALNGSALLALAGRSPDLTGRLDIWQAVGALFVERPVVGWGWVGYWAPWVEPFTGLAERNGVVYLQAHNAFLDVAFQLGVVGLVIFVGLIVSLFVALRRSLLPTLILVALVTQALAESRLLLEGNWALLVILATVATRSIRPPVDGGGRR